MSMHTPHKILEEVFQERCRQDLKWGEQDHNCLRWLGILMEEVGEVSEEIETANYGVKSRALWLGRLEKELIQVAAVCVAWISAIRRGRGSEKLPICACESCQARMKKEGRNQDDGKKV